MKYLIYNSCSNAAPHFGVQLDEAEKFYREENDVIFAYCEGVIDSCFKNFEANSGLCQLCKFGYKKTLNKLSPGIKIVPMKKRELEKKIVFEYSNINEVKGLVYRGVYIGYAVLSTYISLTRNPLPDLTPDSKLFFDHLLDQTCKLTDSIYDLIEKYQPDIICIYNGRFIENKPFFDIAKKLNIKVICNEVEEEILIPNSFKKVYFENSSPLDINVIGDKIEEAWNNNIHSIEDKMIIGKSFYENRRNGLPAGDKVYINNQIKGKLPLNWDKEKNNIVIFNSSEDEFASIGDEFEKYSLFETQIEGIRFILSTFQNNKNYSFYLRIHPNLATITYSYHTNLLRLEEEFDNITVIKSTDPISTYSLIDAAEKIVVFGSTVGIEAVYWGKPTILLAGSLYYNLNSSYIPKHKEEAIDLITSELPLIDTFPTIKYGYFIMESEYFLFKSIYFDIQIKEYSFFGFKFRQPKYMTLFGSNLAMKFVNLLITKIFSHLYKNKIKSPDPII